MFFLFVALSAVIVALTPGAKFLLPNSMEEWVYSVLVGVFGILGQSLLAVALRLFNACIALKHFYFRLKMSQF